MPDVKTTWIMDVDGAVANSEKLRSSVESTAESATASQEDLAAAAAETTAAFEEQLGIMQTLEVAARNMANNAGAAWSQKIAQAAGPGGIGGGGTFGPEVTAGEVDYGMAMENLTAEINAEAAARAYLTGQIAADADAEAAELIAAEDLAAAQAQAAASALEIDGAQMDLAAAIAEAAAAEVEMGQTARAASGSQADLAAAQTATAEETAVAGTAFSGLSRIAGRVAVSLGILSGLREVYTEFESGQKLDQEQKNIDNSSSEKELAAALRSYAATEKQIGESFSAGLKGFFQSGHWGGGDAQQFRDDAQDILSGLDAKDENEKAVKKETEAIQKHIESLDDLEKSIEAQARTIERSADSDSDDKKQNIINQYNDAMADVTEKIQEAEQKFGVGSYQFLPEKMQTDFERLQLAIGTKEGAALNKLDDDEDKKTAKIDAEEAAEFERQAHEHQAKIDAATKRSSEDLFRSRVESAEKSGNQSLAEKMRIFGEYADILNSADLSSAQQNAILAQRDEALGNVGNGGANKSKPHKEVSFDSPMALWEKLQSMSGPAGSQEKTEKAANVLHDGAKMFHDAVEKIGAWLNHPHGGDHSKDIATMAGG